MSASGETGGDARFEDSFKPMRLAARDADDLAVLSALLQDAVTVVGDVAWLPEERRFVMVANRFRWEEPTADERVRVGAHFEDVLAAAFKGFDLGEKTQPIAILSIAFEPAAEPPGGRVRIACAGEAEILLTVEALEAALRDLSKPWPAKARPEHAAAPGESAAGEDGGGGGGASGAGGA